ncbi:uncharacterized protein KGF55_000763 [Candida pseudojiufengensis]|uniref:uncharacterized protein n=1 Tax=Candida pseudojiufengensis TaxID=497109 RepID=UPI0022245CC4|nr:uncharacterized protein KGF55_000763 [Candida pseudojiufengensis]KAI5966454.1 hypothetical protein KGF55_000763 [Candida pseudojiufengensis]
MYFGLSIFYWLFVCTNAQFLLKLRYEPNYLPIYESSTEFFEQSDINIPTHEVDLTNFGLRSNYSWQDVLEEIDLSPNQKLFFLQRHAEGYHLTAKSHFNFSSIDWRCYWSLQKGKDGIEWYDAELTEKGYKQTHKFTKKIKSVSDFPIPQRFYVSPLRRTLQTWWETWNDLTEKTPIIKEFAREIYGIDSESERHNKSYIEHHFPEFEFESGFSFDDVLWSSEYREKTEHCQYRAASLLRDIFDETSEDDKIISIVSHSGLIYCILDVVQHRYYGLSPGGLIPVIIEIQNDKKIYPLDDAYSNFTNWCPYETSSISERIAISTDNVDDCEDASQSKEDS